MVWAWITTPNNLTNYPLSDLYLHPLVTVTGQLYLYDNNSTWNQGFYDGYTPYTEVQKMMMVLYGKHKPHQKGFLNLD